MFATLAPLLLAVQPIDRPAIIDVDALTLVDARKLAGQEVLARFTADTPADMHGEGADTVTLVGPAKDDGAEWCVLLKGRRLDVDAGDPLRVIGTLRVIEHPAAVVNGESVPVWSEVRVTEG